MIGPVSGAHFNPVISAADWFLGHRTRAGLPPSDVLAYTVAQVVGAILGAALANVMYGLAAVERSTRDRASWPAALAEVVATAELVVVIFALARTGRGALTAAAVGAYIGAAYWFTSSTSFANPAVTIGRIFSDTFAGIAPASAPVFIAAQLVGGVVGLALVRALFPVATDRTPAAESVRTTSSSRPDDPPGPERCHDGGPAESAEPSGGRVRRTTAFEQNGVAPRARWWRPMRSRTASVRKAAEWCRFRLARFSGKIDVCSVQRPPASAAVTCRWIRALPTPRPRKPSPT